MAQPVSLTLDLPDPDASVAFAKAMASVLGAGDTVLLRGPVGAGKTHFARTLIQEKLTNVGAFEEVPSPTYTLVQTYQAGTLEIWHADFYRLAGIEELHELGLEEALPHALCLIEWPDLLPDSVEQSALSIAFSPTHEGASRAVEITGGGRWAGRLAQIQSAGAVV